MRPMTDIKRQLTKVGGELFETVENVFSAGFSWMNKKLKEHNTAITNGTGRANVLTVTQQ